MFAKFKGLKIDGTLIDESNYLKEERSTIITLKPEYLDTLAVGEHEMTIAYVDGEVSTNFTVKNGKNPPTGDSIALWISIFTISTLGVIGTAKFYKK